jgi:hypothetical protein
MSGSLVWYRRIKSGFRLSVGPCDQPLK